MNIGQRSGKVGLNTHRLFIFSTNSWFLATGALVLSPPNFKTFKMKTIQPDNPPKDFNSWITYIYSLIKSKQ